MGHLAIPLYKQALLVFAMQMSHIGAFRGTASRAVAVKRGSLNSQRVLANLFLLAASGLDGYTIGPYFGPSRVRCSRITELRCAYD